MDVFKLTEPSCISFSGGRTSAYMLWRFIEANDDLPDDCIVTFANYRQGGRGNAEVCQGLRKVLGRSNWSGWNTRKPKNQKTV